MSMKATAPVPMSLLDRQIAVAKQRLAHATNDDVRRIHAETVVGLRFERGDFPMIQKLDADTRRGLVAETLNPPGATP
jgi:hypothetical protein